MNNTTTELTRVLDDRKVIEANQQVLQARKDQGLVTREYEHTRNLASGLCSAAIGEQHQAVVDLPEMERRWSQGQLNVQAAEDALTQAKQQARADRVPIFQERLKVLVEERDAKGEDLVPTNDAILALHEEANYVLGGSQREVPNLAWPEFRKDGMLPFRRKQHQQEGWLST